mmetsp:Transcript_41158/g.132449  ORF Transcript_41158/g.132449 Transcript_41158/m.132449 type:complete len:2416 (-) Transcript_41158:30-7277(-)
MALGARSLAALAVVLLSGASGAFLGDELPLKVLSVLPSSGISRPVAGATARLSGRTALTVVFSRAVIALGGDWSEDGNDGVLRQDQLPFKLEACDGQPEFAVPGKIRWLSTSIARFDADVDWPTDLCFDLVLNPALKSYDGLAVPAAGADAQSRWRFTTGQVSMSLANVFSERASKLTDGRWSARMSGGKQEAPPDALVALAFSSDIDHATAFSSLQAGSPEWLGAGADAAAYEVCGKRCLAVRPRGLEAGRLYRLVLPAGAEYSKLAGKVGQEQSVELSGLMPFSFSFWFRTPPKEDWRNRKFRYRRYHMYLRHGLESNVDLETQMAALKSAISLVDDSGRGLRFDLSLKNNATLQLQSAELQPNSDYTISVAASSGVKDGFGQALQASSMTFTTADGPDTFLQPQDSPAYFRSFPLDWKVLSAGDGNSWCSNDSPVPGMPCSRHPYEVNAWPVSVRNIVAALAQRFNQQQTQLGEQGKVALSAPADVHGLQALGLDSSKLLLAPAGPPSGRGGLFLREMRQYGGSASRAFVSVASFGASLVATAAGSLLVWAARFEGLGAAVAGAAVSVYRVNSPWNAQESDIQLVASGTTGPDGLATLRPSSGASASWGGNSYSAKLVAVIESAEHGLALCEETPVPWEVERVESLSGALVTDRAIYKPGDTLFVKGYVRKRNKLGTAYSLPTAADGRFAVEVMWKSDPGVKATSQRTRVEVSVSEKYGAWSANVTVPIGQDSVGFGDIPVTLLRLGDELAGYNEVPVASENIVVADPRPPTVALRLSTEAKVVRPGAEASLDVEIHTTTYSGAPVEGASLELTWRLNRAGWWSADISGTGEIIGTRSLPSSTAAAGVQRLRPGQPMSDRSSGGGGGAEGQVKIVTGPGGLKTFTLNLTALLKDAGEGGAAATPCEEGDTLSVSARWVGPTREVVTAELEGGDVKVARSPYALVVRPSKEVNHDTGVPLPGTSFGLYVDVRDPDGGSVRGTAAIVSLHEWDGSPLPSDLMTIGNQVGHDCSAYSDDGHVVQCASILSLPKARKYVVLARAADPNGVPLMTAFSLGRTAAEWAEHPLASLDTELKAYADKKSYKIGDVANILVMPPFERATAMVVWGNGPDVQIKFQDLQAHTGQQGEVVIAVPIGEECRLGCNALVLLAAPSQKKEYVLPVSVPTSPLLDVTLPRSMSTTVRLNVPEEKRVLKDDDVKVWLTAVGEDSPLEVVQPGAKATLRVALPAQEAGSEVCLFVTDKAMLDVGATAHPHTLADLGRPFELSGGDAFRSADTRERLASEDGYAETVDTALRRSKMDPWLVPGSWSLQPNAWSRQPVEKTDEAYLDEHTDDLTEFPMGGGGPIMLGDAMGGGGGMVERSFAMAMPEMVMEAAPMMMAANVAPQMAEMAMDRSAERGSVMTKASMRMAPPTTTPQMPAQAPGGGAGAGAGQFGSAMYMRTKFKVTPLFLPSLIVGADGMAEVELTLPDNIATFEVRAYVVDGKGENRFARGSTSVISRREVSLVPSLPRIVHPGDRFECGVTVTRQAKDTSAAQPSIYVTAAISGNSSVVRLRSDAAGVGSGGGGGGSAVALVPVATGPEEITFPFEAPSVQLGGGVGEVKLTFSATEEAQGGLVFDALEAALPVRAAQDAVVIGTSMAIAASAQGGGLWAEVLALPEATPGSGTLRLTAGVGHLPSVVDQATEICCQEMDNAESAVAALLPAASLRLYFAPDAGSKPSDVPGPVLAQAAMAFEKALQTLPSLTDQKPYNSAGLVWSAAELGFSWLRCSVSLNAFGLLAARLVDAFAARAPLPGAAGRAMEFGTDAWAALELRVPPELPQAWRAALEFELQQQLTDLYSGQMGPRCEADCYTAWDTMAEVRASLGFEWAPTDQRLSAEFAMHRLFSEPALQALSPAGLAGAALAYTLHAPLTELPPEAAGRLDLVYGRLANMVRIQGRTAYIAASEGGQHSAGLGANAAVLLALACAGPHALERHFAATSGSSLAARLAAYVADGGGQSARFGGGRWASARTGAIAAAALAAYDASLGMTAPDVVFSGSSGASQVIAYEAHGVAKPPVVQETSWDALSTPPEPVQFRAVGSGEVSVVAMLTFVPAVLPTKGSIYRGIFVEKIVRSMDPVTGRATGPPLRVVALGASVVVTIQITTPDDLSRVVLDDFASGGLEPVDTSVAGDAKGNSASDGCNSRGGWRMRFMWWCWPSFYQLSVRPDRVRWSSQSTLYAGTHTVSYQATAATRGVFVLPPAHAYVVEQPELLGLSRAGTVVVAEEKTKGGVEPATLPDPKNMASVVAFLARVGVEPPAVVVVPKACPGGCPNGGVCQLDTGKCGCYQGAVFKQGDCPSGEGGLLTTGLVGSGSDVLIPETFHSSSDSLTYSQVAMAVVLGLAIVSGLTMYAKKQQARYCSFKPIANSKTA